MDNHIWMSAARSVSTLWMPMTSDLAEMNRELAIEIGHRNDTGEALGAECFPKSIWVKSDAEKDISALPDFFLAGSFWIVSDKVSNVLRQHDLGEGNLYPVHVFGKDQATVIKGNWSCFNFGNAKGAFLPDLSKQHIYPGSGGKSWMLFGDHQDDDLKFSARALQGSEVWIDPSLPSQLFFSDRLKQALEAAKADNCFRKFYPLMRGQVVAVSIS